MDIPFKLTIYAACIALSYLFSPYGHSQDIINIDNSCSYYEDVQIGSVYSFNSDSEAINAVDEIVAVSGLPRNFEISAAGIPNAAAVIMGTKRHIIYNQTFMNDVYKVTGNYWAAYSILAHEIGHHLAGHTLDGEGSRPSKELEADKFSGFIMNRLGATLSEAQLAINLIGSDVGSSTHPAKRDRLAAIANGWVAECERTPECREKTGSSSKTLNSSVGNKSEETVLSVRAYTKNDSSISKRCAHDAKGEMIIVESEFTGLIVSTFGVPFEIKGKIDSSRNIYRATIYNPILYGELEGTVFDDVGYGTWTTMDGCSGVWEAYSSAATRQTFKYPHNEEATFLKNAATRKQVQNLLNQKGYSAGKADGVFGKNTRSAIKQWQKDNDIVSSGYITEEMFNLLSD